MIKVSITWLLVVLWYLYLHVSRLEAGSLAFARLGMVAPRVSCHMAMAPSCYFSAMIPSHFVSSLYRSTISSSLTTTCWKMSISVLWFLTLLLVFPVVSSVDPTMRLSGTTVYVEVQGPCRSDGSFDGVGGSRLRPVVVRGLPVVDNQHAHIVLANVSNHGPHDDDLQVVDEVGQDPASPPNGGARAAPAVQPVVGLPINVTGTRTSLLFS